MKVALSMSLEYYFSQEYDSELAKHFSLLSGRKKRVSHLTGKHHAPYFLCGIKSLEMSRFQAV